MAEYVNKAKVKERIRYDFDYSLQLCEDTTEVIDSLPSIDIIHCSECKYAEPHECFNVARQEEATVCVCRDYGFHYPDWFCADGERGE